MKDQLASLRQATERLDQIEAAGRKHPGAFFSFFMDSPVPAWIKSTSGKMVLSNRAYERTYGIAPEEYINHIDADNWQEVEAEGFGDLDRQAAETNALALGVEHLFNKQANRPEALFVAKWPTAWDGDGKVIKVGGIVLMTVVEPPGPADEC